MTITEKRNLIKQQAAAQKFLIELNSIQSKIQNAEKFHRIKKPLNREKKKFYKPFDICGFSRDQRRDLLQWIITASPYKGNIGLILLNDEIHPHTDNAPQQ